MNEFLEIRIDTSGLASEEQILLRALVNLLQSGRPQMLAQYVQVLHRWEQAPVQRRALALKLMDDRLPSKLVAKICGLSDRQLRRYTEYQRFAQMINQRRSGLSLRRLDENGDVEV